MIRLVPFKNTHFTDAEAKVTSAIVSEENGQTIIKFYSLPLEMNKIFKFELDISSRNRRTKSIISF